LIAIPTHTVDQVVVRPNLISANPVVAPIAALDNIVLPLWMLAFGLVLATTARTEE